MSDLHGGRAVRRPRQVTVAGGLALTGCVLLVFQMLDSMSRVRSVDVRDSIDRFLSTPPGNGLGVEVDQVIGMMRGLVFVTGALAAAGGVLAVYVLRRHRPARVGLTVTAVLLVVIATTLGTPLLPFLVAIAAAMLWSREARDWFEGRSAAGQAAGNGSTAADGLPDGRPPGAQPGPQPGPQSGPQPAQQPAQQPGQAPDGQPEQWRTPSLPPWQQQPHRSDQPGQQPSGPPAWQQYGPPPSYHPAGSFEPRPGAVTAAAVLTWVFAGLTTMVFSLLVLSLLVQQDAIVEGLQRDRSIADLGLTRTQLVGSMWVLAAVGIFWSLSAITLAVLAFRRVNAARVLLAVSAAVSGLVGILAVPVGWVHALAAFATVVLLLVGPSHRWFLRRPPTGAYGGPFPGQHGGQHGGQYGAPPPGWTPWQQPQQPLAPPEQYPGQDPQQGGDQSGQQPGQPPGAEPGPSDGEHRPPSGKPPVW